MPLIWYFRKMNLLWIASILMGMEAYMCYKCFVESIWLTKYWAVTLMAHAVLSIMAILAWIYGEYHIIQQIIDARRRMREDNQIPPVPTEEDYAAVLQAATRRKLSLRTADTETRGISKQTKSATSKRITIKYED